MSDPEVEEDDPFFVADNEVTWHDEHSATRDRQAYVHADVAVTKGRGMDAGGKNGKVETDESGQVAYAPIGHDGHTAGCLEACTQHVAHDRRICDAAGVDDQDIPRLWFVQRLAMRIGQALEPLLTAQVFFYRVVQIELLLLHQLHGQGRDVCLAYAALQHKVARGHKGL